MNYAARFVAGHETARDLVQDSFARLWERRCELRELDLASLLFTMVRNACLNYLKHNGVVARHELEYTARMRGEERIYSYDFLSDAEQPCLYEELQREVQKAVDALLDRCREVFRMSRFEGLKNREIAARLADVLVVTSDNPRTEEPMAIIREILAGIPQTEKPVYVEENRRRAIRMTLRFAQKDDMIVLAGKGHETYQVLGTEKIHFDEREEVAACLQEEDHEQ